MQAQVAKICLILIVFATCACTQPLVARLLQQLSNLLVMKNKKLYFFILITFYTTTMLAKTRKTNTLRIDTLISWLTDSSKQVDFIPFKITNRCEITNWSYPINRILKNTSKITLYNQKINGVTSYYIDSSQNFYVIYVYFKEKSGKIILDSLHKDLGKDDYSYDFNKEKLNIGDVIYWSYLNNNKSVRYFGPNVYLASSCPGYNYKYFKDCNYIEIFNLKAMPPDFYNNYAARFKDKNAIIAKASLKDRWKKWDSKKFKKLKAKGKVI